MSREKTAVFSPLLACKFYHAGDFFARGFMDLKCSCNIKVSLILQSPLRGSWIRGILHYYIAWIGGELYSGVCFIIRKLRLGFWFLFWLHQGRIPHRMCRFHCCLAAHQRTKEKDSAEPLSSILWTPPPHPGGIRCGGAYLLPRAWGNIGFRYPVQVAHRQFRILFGCFVFGL